MASTDVMAAIEMRIASVWSGLCSAQSVSPAPPVITPNKPQLVPDDGSSFLVVEYPLANEEMKSFGAPSSNTWRETGAIVFTLCAPIGGGLRGASSPWAPLMDSLRASFRGQTLSAGSGSMVIFEVSPTIFRPDSDSGAYCELSASAAYWHDIIG